MQINWELVTGTGLVLSIACNIIQILEKYSEGKKKEFAAETDFTYVKQSLRNVYEQGVRLDDAFQKHEEQAYRRVRELETGLTKAIDELRATQNILIIKLTGDSISSIVKKDN